MDTIQISVIKRVQKEQNVYLGYLSKDQAKKLTFSDHYPPKESRLGYQRPPEPKRARTFADYLSESHSGFATPILLNARDRIEYVTEGNSDFGYVRVPEKACLAIVDGQHRTMGIIDYLEMDLPIPFMLFENLDTQLEQELFITINREQKKVNMSHVKFFESKNDPYSRLVIKLESDADSPWYQRVNLVGARGTKRPVSLQSLRDALEELLQSGQIKMLEFEEQYKIAAGFWEIVSRVWPDAWEAPKNSLLKKSMGTLALSKLGGYLIPQCLDEKTGSVDYEKLHSYLTRASEVNWMSDGDFKGFSGRHAADLVKSHLDSLIFSKTGANQ